MNCLRKQYFEIQNRLQVKMGQKYFKSILTVLKI